jgi:hypothetical protein
MRIKWLIWFSLLTGTYISCLFLKYSGYSGFVTSYLADIISLPLILSALLFFMRHWLKQPNYYLSLKVTAFAFLYEMIVFEYLLPGFSQNYVADFCDIIAYGIGALCFFFSQYIISEREELTVQS